VVGQILEPVGHTVSLPAWPVDRPRLVRVLESLEARIAIEGGQRPARPYLRSQLRRLRRQLD